MIRTRRNGNIGKFVSAIVLGLVILLGAIGWYDPSLLSKPFYLLASPVWSGANKAGEYVMGKSDKSLELEAQVSSLESEVSSLKREIIELEDIKRLFADSAFNLSDALVARVIKKPPSIPYDMLILGSGREAGVTEGDMVMASGDSIIGEIWRVYGKVSTAILYSSPGRSIPVLVGDKAIALNALGRGGGVFEAMIPRDTEIVEGESVMLQSSHPLSLGTISYIFSNPTDPFKTVLFRLPTNISELKWVRIVPDDVELHEIEISEVQLPDWQYSTSTSTATSSSPGASSPM